MAEKVLLTTTNRSRGSGTRWRWWVARQVNRLPGMCWASLASWALRYPGQPLRECKQTYLCHTEAWQDRCYCGKVRIPPLGIQEAGGK